MKMRKLECVLLVLGVLWMAATQVQAEPIGQIISYQGKLTDAQGNPVSNVGTKTVTFKLYTNNGTGVSIPTSPPSSTVSTLGGVFSVRLNVGNLTFNPASSYELGITYNGAETRHPIAGVPFAKSAASVTGPGSIPVGGVIMWWSNGSVPAGWAVCDGRTNLNGKPVPDLTNKFVRGTANADLRTTPVDGGSDSDNHTHATRDHTLTEAQIPPHRHSQQVANSSGYGGADGATSGSGHDGLYHYTNGTNYTGGGQPHNHGATEPPSNVNTLNNVPAYVGLVYIIRIY